MSLDSQNRERKSGSLLSFVRRRVPIIHWLPNYRTSFLFSDLLAGITVSLTVIPQGIAYAAVAGLPLQYGLYTAFMAPFMLVLFSTVPEITMGPTAVMAIMSLSYVTALGPGAAGLLSFLCGVFILVSGLLNLGFLTELISGTVLSGFCSAAASTVLVLQVRTMLSLKFPGNTCISVLIGIAAKITETRIEDFALGMSTVILLVFLKNLSWMLKKFDVKHTFLHHVAWIITISRNAIAIGIGCIVSYTLTQNEIHALSLTGYIEPGIPELSFPSFTYNLTSSSTANGTIPPMDGAEALGFFGTLQFVGTGFVLLAVVSILEHVAIANTVSSGVRIDSSQELCSLGIANLMGSFVGGFPVTASFARSAVQKASGAKTPLCNFFTGAIVLLSIAFLTESFYYIPKVSLAAVIACAVAPMIEYEEVAYLWKVSKVELVPFMATFLVCISVSIEAGILVGAAIHLLIVAFHTTRKSPTISKQGNEVVIVAQRSLYFSGVEMLRSSTEEVLLTPREKVVVDMRNVHYADATSLKALEKMFDSAHSKGSPLEVANLLPKIRNRIIYGLGDNSTLLKGYADQELSAAVKARDGAEQEVC